MVQPFIALADTGSSWAWQFTDTTVFGLSHVRCVINRGTRIYYLGDDTGEATGTIYVLGYELVPVTETKRIMSRKAPKSVPRSRDAHLEELRAIVGREFVLTDEDALHNHSHDYTEDLRFLPQVVVRPDTAEQVAAILRFCNRTGIPATPRGAGTGLNGGALPVLGGVVIAMDRFNRILSIDERNLQATVEPGVINQVFRMR